MTDHWSNAWLHRWLRDLHLHFGLLVSPFVLLFAASVFYLNHGKLGQGPPPTAERFHNLNIPDGLDRLKGREAVDRARAILPQVGVSGEIGSQPAGHIDAFQIFHTFSGSRFNLPSVSATGSSRVSGSGS